MPPVVVIITGASRGFGRALAIVAASAFASTNDNVSTTDSVKLILVARSMEGLLETESLIREQEGPGSSADVSCQSMDLGDLDRLDDHIDKICREIEAKSPQVRRIILLQNAGTIGHLGRCRDSPSLKDMQLNVDLNITSTLWISARMSRYAKASSTPITIVNVSSLVAVDHFPTFGIYSAGKSARDKYHTILAKEEASTDDEDAAIRTLNYAPGPLETDMVEEIRANMERIDASLQPGYRERALDPMDSARKLVQLLEKNDFESGAHIDFYDLPDTTSS